MIGVWTGFHLWLKTNHIEVLAQPEQITVAIVWLIN